MISANLAGPKVIKFYRKFFPISKGGEKIMAKVDGPLMSIEARGKIADAIVFFPWKGRHVVRQWLKPTNKKSTLQGYVRVALTSIGKWTKQVVSKSNGGAVDSKVYALMTAKVPAGLNWNAFGGQGFLNLIQTAGTLSTALFTSLVAAYSALGTDVLTAFKTNATALGMADLAFEYGYTTNVEAGCQLYFGALSCYNNSIQASAPYNTDPDSWAASDVNAFKTDMTATD